MFDVLQLTWMHANSWESTMLASDYSYESALQTIQVHPELDIRTAKVLAIAFIT